MTELDLTADEQERVRNALFFLRAKFGTWKSIARLLHFEEVTLKQIAGGTRTVTASLAFRIARIVNVKIDDLIGGQFPEPGLCPRCGYRLPIDGSWRSAKDCS